MTGDLKQLLAEVGVLVKSATVCGEAVLASSFVDAQAFNQMMIFLHHAGVLCASAHQSGRSANPDVVFPRFRHPPSHDVVIQPRGTDIILPFKGP
jgi:hypothetical protein